jgi:hypothetical protein
MKGHQKDLSAQFPSINNPSTSKNSSNKFRNTLLGKNVRSIPKSVANSPLSRQFQISQQNRRLNGVSHRYGRDQNPNSLEQRRKIRMISLIDSKPINPYITLISLKEFLQREQNMGSLAGSIQTSVGVKEKEAQKKRDFAKILREDLNQQYEEKIGKKYSSMAKLKEDNEKAKNEEQNKDNQDLKEGQMKGESENKRHEWNSKYKHLLNPDFAKIIEDKIK